MPKKAFLNLPPEKRENMLESAMRLYIDRPYEEITLKMLLDALSLHPTTFYRYFDDKDELYLHICASIVDRWECHCRDQNADFDFDIFIICEDMGPITELEMAFMRTFVRLPQDILLRGYVEIFKDSLFRRCKSTLRRMRCEGRLNPDIDDDLISYMCATAMFNMVLFYREFEIDDEALQCRLKESFYTGFFMRGLLRDPE